MSDIDEARKKIRELRELFGEAALKEAILAEMFSEAADQPAQADPENPLPEVAPKLWADRPPGRGTNPSKFIIETYGPWGEWTKGEDGKDRWTSKVLTRAAVKNLDQPLYQAYATWIKRHPKDDLYLPTRVYSSGEIISEAEFAPLRERAREYEAARKKRQRVSRICCQSV